MEHSNYKNPIKKDRGYTTYVISAHGSSFKPFVADGREPEDIDVSDIDFYTLVEDSYALLSGNLSLGLAAGTIRNDICEQNAKLYRKLRTYPDMILDIDRQSKFIAGIYKCPGFISIIKFSDMPDKLINGIQYKSSLSETIGMIKGYHINSSESHKKIKIVAAFCLSGLPNELDVIDEMIKELDLNKKSKSVGSISDLSSLLVKNRSKNKKVEDKLKPKKTIKKQKQVKKVKQSKVKQKNTGGLTKKYRSRRR
jgi:hypothetical protein